jgi:hypothetical protein
MVDRFAEWALTGAVSVPAWALIAGLVVIVAAFAFVRSGFDGRGAPLLLSTLVLVAILTGWWALDHLARRDRAAEQEALEARALELAARASAPGSALACLDPLAGDMVEACEKAVFASPEATAAAVSYVATQLSFLNSAGERARRAVGGSATAQLRRVIEADRFGIAAHVLAIRDGCTPGRCGAFALLQDSSRVSANLAERPFDAQIKRYAAGWQAAGNRPVASNLPPAAPGTLPRSPSSLYFPSASSIPPVSIMSAEPKSTPPHDTTGEAAARKPAPGAAPAAPPSASSNSAPARPAPMQLAPPQ